MKTNITQSSADGVPMGRGTGSRWAELLIVWIESAGIVPIKLQEGGTYTQSGGVQ
jgi:hypothetical protein